MFAGAAMWTFIVASSWFTLSYSDSSTWVGIITFASMIPFLVVSLPGGLLADRIDRRTLAQLMLFAGFIVTAILAVLVISGKVQLWHVAVLAFFGGAFRAIQEPTIAALVPNQVPQNVLLNAITLNAATRHGARFFGLLIAAPLLAVPSIGVAGVLVLSALLAGIGTLLMARVRTVSSGRGRVGQGMVGGALGDMWDGLVYIYTNKAIALIIILVSLHCALVMSFESICPSSAGTPRRDRRLDLGYLVMGFGAGSLVGTMLLAGVRTDKVKGNFSSGQAVQRSHAYAARCLAQRSYGRRSERGNGPLSGNHDGVDQRLHPDSRPDRLRGRISSLYILHAGGIMAFANLGYGIAADSISASPILFVTGIIFVAVVILLGAGQPVLRQIYRTGQVATA